MQSEYQVLSAQANCCLPLSLRALLLGLHAHKACVSRLLTASPPSSVEMRMNLICFRIHMMRKKRSRRSIVMGLMLLLCRMAQEQSPRREQIQEPWRSRMEECNSSSHHHSTIS